MTDTIFALSSGALPAAIAVIRISGPAAFAAAEQLAGSLPEPRIAALRTLRDQQGHLLDRLLVLAFAGQATATGEPLVEFHCHGSRAVVAAILSTLASLPGLREADPGEFTRRALLNGRLDLTEAEGLGDLLAAETEWQRRAALDSAGGALTRQVEAWRERLVRLAAQAEAAIDYVDDDETALDLTQLLSDAGEMRKEWEQRLIEPRAELLNEGLRVVLGGPPNAGKSSLFNALIGADKAIVTAVAGTTRDLIEARLDLDGLPLVLIDTAGVRGSDDEVERIGIARAEAAAAEADILLWLGSAASAPVGVEAILVHSRADLDGDTASHSGAVRTSAQTGHGLGTLKELISERARTILPPLGQATLNRRQAQTLREASDALAEVTTDDPVLVAEAFRGALHALDRLTGRQSVDDVLDALFGRFCLGK